MGRLLWKRLSPLPLLLAVGALVAVIGCQTMGRPVTTGNLIEYSEAAAGLGFPRPSQQLLDYRDAQDVAAMRRHGWEIWAALTQLAPSGFPIFLTWYQVSEVFGPEPGRHRRLFAPEFRVPSQKALGDGDAILSFNVYNAALRDHVRQHNYHRKATLAALVGRESDILPFPETAIAVKTVWWPVRANALTAFPVWDGEPTRPSEWGRGVQALVEMGFFRQLNPSEQGELASHERDGNDFETFARVVAIDPTRTEIPRGETAEVLFFDPQDLTLQSNIPRTAKVVSLQRFFHVQVNDRHTVDLINSLPLTDQITTRFWKRPFRIGDYVALVAAHVTTREIPDWVWATFWWHDHPDAAPFGVDRPQTIGGVFRQYLMRVAYHGDIPRELDGSPHIAFNPYLEAAFSFGLRSNCVACHQRAVVGPEGPGRVFPVLRGHLSKHDPVYMDRVRLDFLWSLAFEAK
ncbi:MAG TPA: hypothetical protein VNP04_17125 [Alphaproteobacteria bacterium]|nr:hypothetical protein [Alphaproteobacteria bacterium]